MENTPIATPGTKYHNQTESTVNELPSNAVDEQPRTQLIHTSESGVSNQAIDVSYPPGAINARYVIPLMTPSGMKPVILLTDEEINLDVFYDYIPGCALPEQGHVWSDKQDSVSQEGKPTVSTAPSFSKRTLYYMQPFQFYNSSVIVRLICKPALSQSQSMWVSRSDEPLDFSTNRNVNEIGFNWIPSRANEIFVLLPFYNENFIVPTSEDLQNVFGCINVRPITDLVTATGNDAPLSVNYYFSPYKMYTYSPLPIALCPTAPIVGSLTVLDQSAITTGTTDLGVISVSEPTYISTRALSFDSAGVSVDVFLRLDGLQIGAVGKNSNQELINAASQPVLFTTGNYSLDVVTNADGTVGPIALNYANIQGEPISFTPATEQSGDVTCPKEIESDVYEDYFDSFILPAFLELDERITSTISRVSNGFNLSDFKVDFETTVISQNPDMVESRLSHDGKVIFKIYARDKRIGKEVGFMKIEDYYKESKAAINAQIKQEVLEDYFRRMEVDDPVEKGQEQIFEYEYNPKSLSPSLTYGKMIDHNKRENRHDMYLTTLQISATNKYTPFNFTVDLSQVDAEYPYINTREYLRHYLKSRMPIVYVRSNKTPYSNLLCRLVQGTYSSYEEVMQLPGQEWDPTVTDLPIQPYWNFQTPGVTDIVIPFTLVLLSGQIDEAGMQLVIFFNTSTLQYHHKIDYDPTEPARREEDRTVTVNPTNTRRIAEALGIKDGIIPEASIHYPKPPSLPIGNTLTVPDLISHSSHHHPKPSATIYPGDSIYMAEIPKDVPTYRHDELRRKRETEIEKGVEQGCESETKVEREDIRSVEERSPNKLEGVQMETNRAHFSLEEEKTQIEKDYHFVGAITTPLDSTLKFIAIPINHTAFGKMEVTNAKVRKFWQGEPTFKITTAISSVLSSIIYVTQVPADFDFTNNKAEAAIRMYSHTQKVAWNESCELPVKWYSPLPQRTVEYPTDASKPQLGYVVIAFPTLSGATFAQGDQNIKITIHCDTANIGYSRPSNRYPDFSYPGIQYTRYSS